MKTLVACAVLSICCLARATPVCEVAAVQGMAALAGGTALKKGQGLDVGAELRTGAGGRVRLRCLDGSTLVLADQSQLLIEFFEPGPQRKASFMLTLGLLGQRVQPAADKEQSRWQVRTPSAVTAVRGTEFMVEVARDRSTTVHVVSGAVAVESHAPDAEPIGPFQSKGINTRGFKPPASVTLEAAGTSTRCAASSGCKAAGGSATAEMKRLKGRLGSI